MSISKFYAILFTYFNENRKTPAQKRKREREKTEERKWKRKWKQWAVKPNEKPGQSKQNEIEGNLCKTQKTHEKCD